MIYTSIKFKAIIMLIAMFLMCFIFMVGEKNELEGIALTSTVIIAIALLLASCGLIALNTESMEVAVSEFWTGSSEALKVLINDGINDTTREFTVHNDVFDYARGFITDTFIMGEHIHSIETQNIVTNFGGTYVYTPFVGSISSYNLTITEELYNSATKYTQLQYGDFNLKYVYNGLYDILYINNTSYGDWANDGNIFTGVSYYDEGIEDNLFLSYAIRYFVGSGFPDPGFSFFYNSTDDKLYPVLLTNAGSYKAWSFRKLNGVNYFADTSQYPIGEEVAIAVDSSIVLDEDYEIVAPLPMPYELGQIIGQTAGEVIAEQWADVMTIDRYIALYGAIPVTLDATLEMPTAGAFDWTKLNMNISLVTDKFPFSIPFDLADAIENMTATPEVPILEQNLTLAGIDGGNLTLDFTPFQPLANIIKWGILILFNIGLILLTRRIIRG